MQSTLFFRMGDFYEMFYDDAKVAARELSIVETARNKVPMCGVPHHSVDNYVARLIAKGYKVAICEQLEDPKTAKGLVKRDVIRVITPGTVVESNMLEDKRHNYLAAVTRNQGKGREQRFGLAYTDISSGEFMATELAGFDAWDKLADELCRVRPAELLLPADLYEEEFFRLRVGEQYIGSLNHVFDENFAAQNADELLGIHFQVAGAAALGLAEHPLAKLAAVYILDFLQQTQKRALTCIDDIRFYSTAHFMYLDATSRRNLELTTTIRSGKRQGSLLWVLDETLTAMGGRMLAEWLEKPLLDTAAIQRRLDAIAELLDQPRVTLELRGQLREIYDLPRLISRICYGSANPRDLAALKHSLHTLPGLFAELNRLDSPLFRLLMDELDLLEDVAERIAATLKDDELSVSPREGGMIRAGFHREVDELRDISQGGKDNLVRLEAAEKEKTGIKNLKIGFNKVFGYFIEVSKSRVQLVPAHYHRKQTIANGERYITEELKQEESRILGAGERLLALEYQLFTELREQVAAQAARIQRTAEVLATLDVLQSLAKVAQENDYCKPAVTDSRRVKIRAGRHPVVEKILGRENYVPNDTLLDDMVQQLMLITGPNMTGKSTYMRQVALITLLARMGSYVPAEEAEIGRIDRIFTRVDASDDLAAGQSTFMVEMMETSNILRHATPDSLIILDEIGRGTSTYDGLSIAWAVAEYIMRPELAAKTLFATHYHELTALAESYPLIQNYSVSVREKEGHIIFLHKIVPGGADKSYGIHVASLAGLPAPLIIRARELLRELESEKQLQAKINDGGQLSFADILLPPPDPHREEVVKELAELDVNRITPLEAMQTLIRWQKKLQED